MMDEENVTLAVIAAELKFIKETVAEIKDALSKEYVRVSEFRPVRAIVYAMVGIVLVGVMLAILKLAIVR